MPGVVKNESMAMVCHKPPLNALLRAMDGVGRRAHTLGGQSNDSTLNGKLDGQG